MKNMPLTIVGLLFVLGSVALIDYDYPLLSALSLIIGIAMIIKGRGKTVN